MWEPEARAVAVYVALPFTRSTAPIYKRALNENVISQGLFYLDWLMDHQGEFALQVLKILGPEWVDKIDWSGPRLLCIAGDFTRYDEYAVLQIPRNIELLRYRRYGGDLLLLELVRASSTVPNPRRSNASEAGKGRVPAPAVVEKRDGLQDIQDLWEALKAFLLALGDDVQMKELEHYTAVPGILNRLHGTFATRVTGTPAGIQIVSVPS